jgi:pyruvate carboxylase subunit B
LKYYVTVNGRALAVDLVERLGEVRIQVDGVPFELAYEEVDRLGQVALRAGDKSFGASIEGDENHQTVVIAGHLYEVEIEDERERAAHAAARAANKGGGTVQSVMPGVVVQIMAAPGDVVEKGQPLLILEAMKMQNEIGAPSAGVVSVVHVSEGQAVQSGAKLVTLTVPETDEAGGEGS